MNYFEKYNKKLSTDFNTVEDTVVFCVCVWVDSWSCMRAIESFFFALLLFFNIKKRYCIHYYYNHTVIFTLKMVPFSPSSTCTHTYHFLCLWPKDGEGKKSIQNIRPNILLLLALIYSHSIFVWMDFSYFFFHLRSFFVVDVGFTDFFSIKIQKKMNRRYQHPFAVIHANCIMWLEWMEREEINPLNFGTHSPFFEIA